MFVWRNLGAERVSRLTFDWDDQLWNNWQYFAASVCKHILNTRPCKEVVWVCDFAQAIEKQRQVVVEVELLNLNLKREGEGRRRKHSTKGRRQVSEGAHQTSCGHASSWA